MTTLETVIARYQDEDCWTVDTDDPGMVQRLEARGWAKVSSDPPYSRFRLPVKALTIRRKASVDRAANVPPEERERRRLAMAKSLRKAKRDG